MLLIGSSTFAQTTAKAEKSEKIILPEKKDKTIELTEKQEKSLIELENQINALKAKQQELINFIFDAKGFDFEKVTDIKYDKGKFVFTEK